MKEMIKAFSTIIFLVSISLVNTAKAGANPFPAVLYKTGREEVDLRISSKAVTIRGWSVLHWIPELKKNVWSKYYGPFASGGKRNITIHDGKIVNIWCQRLASYYQGTISGSNYMGSCNLLQYFQQTMVFGISSGLPGTHWNSGIRQGCT
jgi:hypothetical protein